MKKWIRLTLVAATVVATSSAYAQVSDPGFEGAGAGAWLPDTWGGPYTVDFDAVDQVHNGSESLKQVATGTSNDPSGWEKAEAKQVFAVNPGDVVNGGAWMRWENLTGNIEAFVEAKWLDINQQELSSSSTGILGLGTAHKTSGSGNWEFQDLGTWSAEQRTAPNEARYIDLRLVLLSPGGAATATGNVWWDDASLTITPIPEASTLVLMGAGLLGMIGAIRRGKKMMI